MNLSLASAILFAIAGICVYAQCYLIALGVTVFGAIAMFVSLVRESWGGEE